jgi:hypothetical protein
MPSTLIVLRLPPSVRALSRSSLRLLLLGLLPACAQGLEFEESKDTSFGGAQDASGPVRDTGPASPGLGTDAGGSGSPQDAWVPPTQSVDTGVGPLDGGTGGGTGGGRDAAADTAVPAPMDAAPDTSTPPRQDAAPSTPDTGPSTPDTGPSTPDTGPSTPDTGTTNPQTCAATPAYPTTTACARCTCMRCGSQVTTCYASNDSAKNTQCARVQACAETNKCVDRDCYCGKDTSDIACLNDQNGACEQVIETAAGTTSPLDVSRAGDDPQSPVGRAALIGACQMANCRSDCGL